MKSIKYIKIGIYLIFCRVLNLKKPLWVTIDVTPICNQTCSYCDKPYAGKALSTDKWIDFITQAYKLGSKRIGLHGGEPLLHPGIGKIINEINKKGMISHIYTNGQLVPSKIEQIKNVDGLFISLDGDEAQHEKNRSKGSFNKAINGILAARSSNIPVTTICTLTAHNSSAPDYVLRLAKKYKFEVVFQLYSITPDSLLTDSLTGIEVTKIFNDLIKRKKSNDPIANSMSSLKLIARNLSNYPQHESLYTKKAKCHAGKLFCEITADGTVFPCFESFDRLKGEYIKFTSGNFKEAWEHINNFQCSNCTSTCGLDTNQLLSLTPSSIWNSFRTAFMR